MKITSLLLGTLLLCAPMISLGHDGHDHEVPGSIQAPRGGLIKACHEKYLEAVVKPGLVEIYAYGEDLKPLDIKTLNFRAEILYPRAKKAEPVKLETEGDHWVVRLGDKKVHRLTLNLEDIKGKDTTSFIIEPKR